jgi:hypothetical protein
LSEPSWTPSPATISLIWAILYPLILISFGFVFVQAFHRKVPWKVAVPFAINLVANLLFMPIFAELRIVAGDGGYFDRVDHDHLVCGRRLAALSLGRRGSGAVLRVGDDCHVTATVDHSHERVRMQ